MKSLALLLIPILFLSSCSIDWNDEKDKNITQPIQTSKTELGVAIVEIPKTQTTTRFTTKDFGSGFTFSQTDDKTILAYSGKTIKTWSHTPPKQIPFVWDEACGIVWEGFEKLSPENQSTGKQRVWDTLTEKEKKNCMKEYFGTNIRTEQINERFYKVIQTNYETATIWIYDIKSGNIQELPTMGDLTITSSETDVVIFIEMSYGDNNMKLTYDTKFSELLSQEEIPK